MLPKVSALAGKSESERLGAEGITRLTLPMPAIYKQLGFKVTPEFTMNSVNTPFWFTGVFFGVYSRCNS